MLSKLNLAPLAALETLNISNPDAVYQVLADLHELRGNLFAQAKRAEADGDAVLEVTLAALVARVDTGVAPYLAFLESVMEMADEEAFA